MKLLARFGRFWYDFIVGDDWTVALGVIVAVALTAIIHGLGLPAWPVLPFAVMIGLFASVQRARRAR